MWNTCQEVTNHFFFNVIQVLNQEPKDTAMAKSFEK